MRKLAIALVIIVVMSALVSYAQTNNNWILIEPGVGFESSECSFKICWIQFSMPIYANEVWIYNDHVWIWGLYIPGYTPKPYNLGIGVWNGNATVVLVTYNLIRVIVDAPAGTKSTLLLFGVQPYRIKCNGQDVTPRAVPDLRALNNSGLAWLHTGQVLYLRATHSSPVVWDIELSEIPQAQPNETLTPIAILPYFGEHNTTTPVETITLTQQEAFNIYTIIAIAVIATLVLIALVYLRRRG